MGQIRAIYESWMHDNRDSKKMRKKWDKIVGAMDTGEDGVEPLIVDYARATEKRGFYAGFKAAIKLAQECSGRESWKMDDCKEDDGMDMAEGARGGRCSIERIIQDFLGEMQEAALEKMHGENTGYIRNSRRLSESVDRVEAFLQGQDEQTAQLLEECYDARLEQEVMEQDFLYKQGIKDGVRYVRLMGLF